MTLIKAYYEKDTEFSYHTEQVIRSFKSFVKQHKNISGYAEKACINFSLITNTLYRIKHQEGRETVDNAISKLENSEFILAEKWLLEKIKELQNRPVRRVQF